MSSDTLGSITVRRTPAVSHHDDPHRDDPVYRLGRRCIFILPTRQGLVFGFVLLLMLAGSMNYENSLGYLMTFQLGAVGLLSIIFAFRDLFGLRVRLTASPPVFCAQTAWFTVHVDNRDERRRYGVLVRRDPRRGGLRKRQDKAATQTVVVRTPIAAGEVQQARVGLTAPHRGWLTLDGVCLASRHPFGLFRAWAPIRLRTRTLVYPSPLGNQPMPGPQGLHQAGAQGQSGSDDDFAGLRAFQRGDTPKHIHWKAAARDNTLPVKIFSGVQGGTVVLSYSQVLATDPEAKISQLCRWVVDADKAGIRYILELPGRRIIPEHSQHMRSQCLAALALLGETGSTTNGSRQQSKLQSPALSNCADPIDTEATQPDKSGADRSARPLAQSSYRRDNTAVIR